MVCDKSVIFVFLTFSNRLRSWKIAAHPCAAGTAEYVQRSPRRVDLMIAAAPENKAGGRFGRLKK
jgi:hypothetical protein